MLLSSEDRVDDLTRNLFTILALSNAEMEIRSRKLTAGPSSNGNLDHVDREEKESLRTRVGCGGYAVKMNNGEAGLLFKLQSSLQSVRSGERNQAERVVDAKQNSS